jgi:hypothetical protein
LVRCEVNSEENLEAVDGMEYCLQSGQYGGDEEVAYIPGEIQEPLWITRN